MLRLLSGSRNPDDLLAPVAGYGAVVVLAACAAATHLITERRW